MDYIVVDDLIPKIEQRNIEIAVLEKSDMEWHYSPYSTYSDTKLVNQFRKNDPNIFVDVGGSFSHVIYFNNLNGREVKSSYFDLFKIFPSFIEKKFNVQVNQLLKMNIMLTMPDFASEHKYGLPHVDFTDFPGGKTIVYYINNSSGDTILFNEKFESEFDTSTKTIGSQVSPKRGRAVMFDNRQYHAASRSTTNHRAIININFI
jgi:hypothetical protein